MNNDKILVSEFFNSLTVRQYNHAEYKLKQFDFRLYSEVCNSWKFDPNLKFIEKLYGYITGSDKMCSCGKLMKRYSWKVGYCCKKDCIYSFEKKKKTMIERHNVEHALQSPLLMKKACDTLNKNHGTSVLSCVSVENRKKTCIDRYGSETPLQSPKIREKIKETCKNNNGVNYPLQSPTI